MPLTAGLRLGPYEIIEPVGAGGMGEVYRARDERLGRDVAVKVLPPAFSADPERLGRFEQEARAAAALNHPNILAVFDVGRHDTVAGGQASPFIVSELLDGQTLREAMADTALPVRRAVAHGVQIARGLAAAHDKGIVHRDLKPDNVFVTTDGRVKILDFGLAKLTQPESTLPAASALPTTPPATTPGIVLGTVGYMSPEQVRGQPADPRSDLFALGVVLYEMLSGKRAFTGDTSMDTMTAILKEDPPDLPADGQIPPALARIVSRCLEKAPAARFKSADDLAFALENLSSTGEPRSESSVVRRGTSHGGMWRILAGVLALVALLLVGLLFATRRAPGPSQAFWTTILPPPDVTISDTSGNVPSRRLAISPDGRQLAFTAAGLDGRLALWVRSLDSTAARSLEGTENATYPFWSPDSRRLGFFTEGQGNAKLTTIALSGGAPVTLCELPGVNASGGAWNQRDEIVFGAIFRGPLRRVSASGGTCTPATTLDDAAGEASHINPVFLPDGRHVLFMPTDTRNAGAMGIHVASLDGTDRRQLVPDGSNPAYADGYLFYARGAAMLARPFDPDSLSFTGEAVIVAEDILVGGQAGFPSVALSVSQAGVLAYQAGTAALPSRLTWVDRAGNELGILGDASNDVSDVELSPDGTRAVASVIDPVRRTRDLWVYDVSRGVRRRLTFDPARDESPVWSPDGSRVVFMSRRQGALDLYVRSSASGTADDLLFRDNSDKMPLDWSPDGRVILYSSNGGETGVDLWKLPLAPEGRAGTPEPYLRTASNELSAKFSHDGRWVAYVSDESGQREVFVAPFPGPGESVQVSTSGGIDPRWSGTDSELFYWAGDRLLTTRVSGRSGRFDVGATSRLFEHRRLTQGAANSGVYDVSSDGQRFLIVSALETAAPVTLIVNWPALLRR